MTLRTSWSEVKNDIQKSGVRAKINQINPDSKPEEAAPNMPIFSEREILLAPIFVPTIVVIAVPMLNTIGISKNSTLEPIPYPAIAVVPN